MSLEVSGTKVEERLLPIVRDVSGVCKYAMRCDVWCLVGVSGGG